MPEPQSPKISVVTVSYNQAQFIGHTIETVMAQNYPNFEHIVVDGGSKDNSREVCERYPHVQFFLAPGTTQAEALNIGFEKATGDIIAWVNSDDYYEPGTFKTIAREIDPARNRWAVVGASKVVDAAGGYLWMLRGGRVPHTRLLLHPRIYPYNGWTVIPCQPSVFFHKKVLEDVGLLNGKLLRTMDYEYWVRMMAKGYRFHYIPQIFSDYRYHTTSHSTKGFDTFLPEWKAVSEQYLRKLPVWRQALIEAWWVYGRLESCVVGYHKAVLNGMARKLAENPELRAAPRRYAVMMGAVLRAPWVAFLFVWQRLFGTIEQRLMAKAAQLAAAEKNG